MRDDVFGWLPRSAAQRWGDALAIIHGTRQMSFAEVDRLVDVAAAGLMALGVAKGDRVALLSTNRPEFIIALYAILKIGAVAVPLNTRYREKDLAYALQFAECRVLVTLDVSGPVDYLGIIGRIMAEVTAAPGRVTVPGFPTLEQVVVIGTRALPWTLPWQRLLAAGAAVDAAALDARARAVDPEDTCLIVYTSGTTGLPKGVMHSHRPLRSCRDRVRRWDMRPGSRTVNYLPMFHLYALSEIVIDAMIAGTLQIVMDGFDPDAALDLIERYRVDTIHGFDTHYLDILRAQEARPRDIACLRFGTFPSGMESSTAVARRVQHALCPTVTGLGMSETWAWVGITTLADSEADRCETSGRPLPGVEVRIVDPATGLPQPAGVPGEIVYRGYTLMQGYYRDPEATRKSVDAEGWFHSGDQGVLRADGFLQFQGRYKEMLRVGGENVSAVGVETELMTLEPRISQVAVVPYPDERLGEVVVAYVVPHAGRPLDAEEVRNACRGKIASFKIPRHVIFVAELPLTASGKVQRGILRERALVELKQ